MFGRDLVSIGVFGFDNDVLAKNSYVTSCT